MGIEFNSVDLFVEIIIFYFEISFYDLYLSSFIMNTLIMISWVADIEIKKKNKPKVSNKFCGFIGKTIVVILEIFIGSKFEQRFKMNVAIKLEKIITVSFFTEVKKIKNASLVFCEFFCLSKFFTLIFDRSASLNNPNKIAKLDKTPASNIPRIFGKLDKIVAIKFSPTRSDAINEIPKRRPKQNIVFTMCLPFSKIVFRVIGAFLWMIFSCLVSFYFFVLVLELSLLQFSA